ncbi:hypothetical protein BOX15_Mlig011130g1 [Macrostomum lignano]|uniref:Integrin_alpha2 domain-containing protein n=1 Tax=Macrostomum lignano TaxID=282301 RepID=A0A267F4D9_9PLAT|nr:hypothetical protein BOX15_Mlig011130g1 [Macrostomum lignano]
MGYAPLLLLIVAIPSVVAKPVNLVSNASSEAKTSLASSSSAAPTTLPVATNSWSWQVTWRTPPIGHRFAAEPLVMDLNSDGADEIVLAGFDGAFSIIGAGDGRAEGLGAWPRFHHGEAHFAAPVRFDVDRDGEEELVFVSHSGGLHFYSQMGELKHEDRLPSIRIPASWLSSPASAPSSSASSAQLIDSPASAASVPIVFTDSADSDYSSRDGRADGQFELLSPSVFATPLLCDCNADNLREEFVLGVSFVGERRLVSGLLLYSLSQRRPLLWHWLEHSWLSSAKPAYLLSAPLWARLLPEHSHYSLVIASASGRLFAHRFDAQANRFVSLVGFPVLLGSILHPPLLLSRLQPSNEKQHQQSPTTLSSSSSSSSGSINLIIVSDSSSASVSAIDARGHVIWSTGRLVPTKSQGASMTPLTALHRAGQLYAVGFVPNNIESGYSNSNHDSNVIIGRLHLISVVNGRLRTVDVRLRTPASEFLLSDSPHQHSLVEPMSRLTPFACQLKPSADRTHQLSSNAHRGTGDDAVTLLGGVDWLGRLATIDLSADLTEAGASLDFGLNATTALGLSGVNSQRTGLADLVVLTTEGRAVKLGYRLIDNTTGEDCDLQIQESLSIRIQGAPYIEQSGSTLILPILIHDLLNPNALLSVVYTVRVHIYNKAVLSLRYPRPGPHLMYFDAGSRPLKSQLLLELTTSADARSAQAQATLVANVNYVYELPFLLYLPVSLTLLLLLGQVFTVEDNLQLPFVARHSD